MEKIQFILLIMSGLIILSVIGFAINKSISKKKQSLLKENASEDKDSEEVFLRISDCNKQDAEYSKNDKKNSFDIEEKSSEENTAFERDDFMMISVHAQSGKVFSDYNFLQTLGSSGLVYGDHKIFHYDVQTNIGTQRLFSVARLNNPGTFDIDYVENINCKGLLFFIDLRNCHNPILALDCMLEAAYQIAEDLEGIMFESYDIPWQEDTPRALAQKLDKYQKYHENTFNELI